MARRAFKQIFCNLLSTLLNAFEDTCKCVFFSLFFVFDYMAQPEDFRFVLLPWILVYYRDDDVDSDRVTPSLAPD